MRVLCISTKMPFFKSQGGVAFSNASLSYCSCFGGRPERRWTRTMKEESNMPVTAKKKAVKKKAKKTVKKKAAKKKKKK